MTQPATSFGPLEAARAIESTRAWDATLRQRTEGLTWMLWGIVMTGIGVSYGEAILLQPHMYWAVGFLWVPWVLVGAAFQTILWRTVSLTPVGTKLPSAMRIFLAILALAGLPLLALGAIRIASGQHGASPASGSGFAIAIGLAWILVGALVRSVSSRGRGVCIAIGLTIVIVGIVPLFATAMPIIVLAQAVVGWAPLLGGFYQALG